MENQEIQKTEEMPVEEANIICDEEYEYKLVGVVVHMG
jgi:hypothetical protein